MDFSSVLKAVNEQGITGQAIILLARQINKMNREERQAERDPAISANEAQIRLTKVHSEWRSMQKK